jgi:diaminopimelate epimerase
MQIPFTKMQGAGNDFVVLDETQTCYGLSTEHYRFLADRHFGVGADQVLTVRSSPAPGIDFEYVIHNADGAEVEQCGNGARCFARFVRDAGLTSRDAIRVQTKGGVIEPVLTADGRVTVNMGSPVFDLVRIPFAPGQVCPVTENNCEKWPLVLSDKAQTATVYVAVLSMGNPHAVQLVDDVDAAAVLQLGPLVEHHPFFPNRINAGFMQVQTRKQIRLRVYERGAGETLACGSGACAAVVTGIRLGLLDAQVDVYTRGGVLTISWAGGTAPVMMTGPATTVFHGTIDLVDTIPNKF